MYYLIICIIFVAAFVIFSLHVRSKGKKEQEEKAARVVPGVRIRAVNGFTGVVTAVTETTAKVDFSPDGTGSVIEISKEAVSRILEDQ